MLAIGIVPISLCQPSFATPIFRGNDELAYVQSSSAGRIINTFVGIGPLAVASRKIIPPRLNYDFELGDEFHYGFVDKQLSGSISTREQLVKKLDVEFSEYSLWPFLQLSFVRLSENIHWIERIEDSSIVKICEKLMIAERFDLREQPLIKKEIEVLSRNRHLNRYYENFIANKDIKVSDYFNDFLIKYKNNEFHIHKNAGNSSKILEILGIAAAITNKQEWNIKELRFLLAIHLLQITKNDVNTRHGAAYIEPRPKSREPHTAISHYTIVSEGEDHGEFKTQEAAIDHACNTGHRPVHVARIRHSLERDKPDHFRVYKCRED